MTDDRFKIEGYSYISYNDYASPTRTAEGLSFILADDNAFCLQIDRDGGERLLQLVQGDICIIFRGTRYHFYTLPGIETRIITLELGGMTKAREGDSEELERLLSCTRDYLVFSGSKELRELMLLLQRCHERQHKSGGTHRSIDCLTAALVCKASEDAFGRQSSAMLCPHTRNAIAYISKNYKEPISLGSLCEAVGVGERRMQKLFREELATTFGDYLTGFRINKACDLLRGSSAPIEEIAELIGYHSRQHFTHTFKQKVGQSPQQFRTATKKRNYRYTRENISSMQYVFMSFEGAIAE